MLSPDNVWMMGVLVEKFILHQVSAILDCLPEYKFQHRAPSTPTICSRDTEFEYAGFIFFNPATIEQQQSENKTMLYFIFSIDTEYYKRQK